MDLRNTLYIAIVVIVIIMSTANQNPRKVTLAMIKGKPIATSVPVIHYHASDDQLESIYPQEKIPTPESGSPFKTRERKTIEEGDSPESRSEVADSLEEIQPTSDNPWKVLSEFKGKITKTLEGKLSEIKSERRKKSCLPKENSSSISDTEDVADPGEHTVDEGPVESTIICRANPARYVGFTEVKTGLKDNSVNEEQVVESGVEAAEFSEDVAVTTPTMKIRKNDKDTAVASDRTEINSKTILLRLIRQLIRQFSYRSVGILLIAVCFHYLALLPDYLLGFVMGTFVTITFCSAFAKLTKLLTTLPDEKLTDNPIVSVVEIPAVEEHAVVDRFQGWLNELPYPYEPDSYRLARTRSVFFRLEGNVLRVFETKIKIAKTAVWNEPRRKFKFTKRRIYDLTGAKVELLPDGLTKRRRWSKKYPICLTMDKEALISNVTLRTAISKECTSVAYQNTKGKKHRHINRKDARKEDGTLGQEVRFFQVDKSLGAALLTDDEDLTPEEEDGDEGDDEDDDDDDADEDEDEDEEEYEDVAEEEMALQDNKKSTEEKEENLEYSMKDQRKYMKKKQNDERSEPNEEQDDPWKDQEDPDDYSRSKELRKAFQDCKDDDDDDGDENGREKLVPLKVFIFARADREKEDWYRRLFTAASRTANKNNSTNGGASSNLAEPQIITTESKNPASTATTTTATPTPNGSPNENALELGFDAYMKKYLYVDKSSVEETVVNDTEWVNCLIARILFDMHNCPDTINLIQDKIQRKLSNIKLPYFMECLLISEMIIGQGAPIIRNATKPTMDERGLWFDLNVTYKGSLTMTVETKLNLMKLTRTGFVSAIAGDSLQTAKSKTRSPIFDSDIEDTPETSTEDDLDYDYDTHKMQLYANSSNKETTTISSTQSSGKKFLSMVDRIAANKYFQHATEFSYVRRAMEGVSNTEIRLMVTVSEIEGTLSVNIPPSPSDRLWYGFKPVPKVVLTVKPAVGEMPVNIVYVTKWIEDKLLKQFEKLVVLPNMDDLVIPLCPNYPYTTKS